jgi:hypothetical protein
VKGYENLYEVSNLGNIRRCGSTKLRQYSISGMGYYHLLLSKIRTHKVCFVHKLVAESFLENPENLTHIEHINHNKLDNNVNNLRYIPAPLINSTNNYGFTYTYISELPEDSVQITQFGNNEYDRLFYSKLTETFYKFIDEKHGYHDILVTSVKHGKHTLSRLYCNDINGKKHLISYPKLKSYAETLTESDLSNSD